VSLIMYVFVCALTCLKSKETIYFVFLKVHCILNDQQSTFGLLSLYYPLRVNAVQKSKNHCGANDLSITVISNRECHEKCVLFAPQWFFDF
jgi:hypothetical protein